MSNDDAIRVLLNICLDLGLSWEMKQEDSYINVVFRRNGLRVWSCDCGPSNRVASDTLQQLAYEKLAQEVLDQIERHK